MIDSQSLSVCIDFKNPEAYLAWAPTCELAKKQNIEINWLPFVGPQPKVPDRSQPDQKADRGTLHRRKRFDYRQRNIMRYSINLNLTREALNREINSEPAALGLLWCRQVSHACTHQYIESVFTTCWQQKADISDPAVIRNAIESADSGGKSPDAFLVSTGPRMLAEIRQELEQQGVFDTPFYLLQGEVFLGRQHLPMIQWLLSGKQNTKPI